MLCSVIVVVMVFDPWIRLCCYLLSLLSHYFISFLGVHLFCCLHFFFLIHSNKSLKRFRLHYTCRQRFIHFS